MENDCLNEVEKCEVEHVYWKKYSKYGAILRI